MEQKTRVSLQFNLHLLKRWNPHDGQPYRTAIPIKHNIPAGSGLFSRSSIFLFFEDRMFYDIFPMMSFFIPFVKHSIFDILFFEDREKRPGRDGARVPSFQKVELKLKLKRNQKSSPFAPLFLRSCKKWKRGRLISYSII